MAKQVHGRDAVVVRHGYTTSSPRLEADVLLSDAADIAIAVRVADCVPLLMADRVRGAVAAVHAGWRGTVARAAPAAVQSLEREFGTRPADLVVAIGLSIGSCCYEVGPELVDAFAAAGPERHLIDRWFLAPPPPRGSRDRPALRLDIARANADQLVLAGVPGEQIYSCGLCTAMHLTCSRRIERRRKMPGGLRACSSERVIQNAEFRMQDADIARRAVHPFFEVWPVGAASGITRGAGEGRARQQPTDRSCVRCILSSS
jgi:YfiH family protein